MAWMRMVTGVVAMFGVACASSNAAGGGAGQSGAAAGSDGGDAGQGGVGGVAGQGGMGGSGGGAGVAGASQDLAVALQVGGAMNTCGTCSTVTATITGGMPPYRFEWSDASLVGPGPHTVCPEAPQQYSVTVTDTAIVDGEFPRAAQQATAQGEVACVPMPDAGVIEDGGDGGYFTGCASSVKDGANDLTLEPMTCMEAPGPAPKPLSYRLVKPLRAGHSYRLTLFQVFPVTFGTPVRLPFYGSNEACVALEPLGTIERNGMAANSICFTAGQDYTHIFHEILIDGTLFDFEISQGATLCEEACAP